ncbi:MAG: uroporphyrinogen-III synthase [Bdellovibrionales bacterium]|nr:uroporphyrinogen-III synthase [Bdellovibrionales bacterium]
MALDRPATWVVVNTRPRGQSEPLTRLFSTRGFSVLPFPALEISPVLAPNDPAFLSLADSLANTDCLVFTSGNAVRLLAAYLERNATREVSRKFFSLRAAAVGEKTAQRARMLGIEVEVIPAAANSDALGASLVDAATRSGGTLHSCRRFILFRGKLAAPGVQRALEAAGLAYEELVVYESRCPRYEPAELQLIATVLGMWGSEARAQSPVLVVTSSQAARNLVLMLERYAVSEKLAESQWRHELSLVPVVAIGPKTEKTASQLGLRVAAVAPYPSDESLVSAVESILATEDKKD